jgi:hypothetical protein
MLSPMLIRRTRRDVYVAEGHVAYLAIRHRPQLDFRFPEISNL